MRLIVAVTVNNMNLTRNLRPVIGWTSPHLTYLVRFECEPCRWLSPYVPISAANHYRRGNHHFNAMQMCPHSGYVGTVLILQTMGSPIRVSRQVMPVLLVEVMGLPLDYGSVDFNFQWRVQLSMDGQTYVPWGPFLLHRGSWVMDMDESTMEMEDPPAVVDAHAIFMPAD